MVEGNDVQLMRFIQRPFRHRQLINLQTQPKLIPSFHQHHDRPQLPSPYAHESVSNHLQNAIMKTPSYITKVSLKALQACLSSILIRPKPT